MDMKQILQALDKASSRRVEGANDMRRFVSAVRKLNNLSEQSAEPTDPGYQRFAELMAKYNMLQREVGGTDNLIKVSTSVSPDAKAEIDSMRAKAVQIAGPNLQAWDKAYAAANAPNPARNAELAKQFLEASKPGDPDFKPNLQVPQAPVLPNVQLQPGANDMGDGVRIDLNPDGTKKHISGQGTFTFDKNNKPIKYVSPNFSGLSQTHDLVTGNVTATYAAGPVRASQTYDKSGNPIETDAEYTMGTQTVGMNKNAKGITTKRATSQDPNVTPDSKDLYAMGDKDKEATYNRAMAQVNKSQPANEGRKSFLDYLTLAEEKQKGVDGKACWDGYKRMGTKKKGGKTVDNCVPTGKK
jgi:hypothetical protein